MAIKSCEVQGLDELIKATRKISDKAMPALDIKSKEAAQVVLAKAQAKVPVDTGNLRSLLKVTRMGKKKSAETAFWKVSFGKGGAYGIPLELGHRLVYMGHQTDTNVQARPFLRPAADESKAQVADMIVKTMDKLLEEWGR
jgi:HK97 gp10 family phage protein